ncbi:hypothetical protein VMCG_03213 [Cytospora schulzeri]|uniref:SRR1-like domain-containing protein n=1 Tax=Cytospora schulzeri TaxID=448051 RepID=A0A423WYC4_9PEZI|nr:hypothetical protein VMCG_03213 [Valsa malicola]
MTWAGYRSMRSMAQHALALMMQEFLGSDHTSGAHIDSIRGVQCYAQDPIYTPIDEQVLCEAGFTVVEDPRAFLEVDESSVIISISPDIPVMQIIADIARPAIMIWNKVSSIDRNVLTDPVSPRVDQMLEDYIELPFPAENESFGNLAMYIRKARQTEKDLDTHWPDLEMSNILQ